MFFQRFVSRITSWDGGKHSGNMLLFYVAAAVCWVLATSARVDVDEESIRSWDFLIHQIYWNSLWWVTNRLETSPLLDGVDSKVSNLTIGNHSFVSSTPIKDWRRKKDYTLEKWRQAVSVQPTVGRKSSWNRRLVDWWPKNSSSKTLTAHSFHSWKRWSLLQKGKVLPSGRSPNHSLSSQPKVDEDLSVSCSLRSRDFYRINLQW